MIVDNRWAGEVVDIMTTMELALLMNSEFPKDSVVRRTARKLKKCKTKELRMILQSWVESNKPFESYSNFMEAAGL